MPTPPTTRPARPIALPRPCPPVPLRPRTLRVTEIETWLADPYAIYARHLLGLKALDPIDMDPGAAERGTMIHRALDRFVAVNPYFGLADRSFEEAADLLEELIAFLAPKPLLGQSVLVTAGPTFEAIDPVRGRLAGKPAVMPGHSANHVGIIDLQLERRTSGQRRWHVVEEDCDHLGLVWVLRRRK